MASSAVADTHAEAREAAKQFAGVNREVLSTIRAGQADFTQRERQRSGLQEGDDIAQEVEKLFDSVEGPAAVDLDMEAIDAQFDD